MKVLVIMEEPFPVGMAVSNRILSIARGLVEENVPVKVLCLRSGERRVRETVNTRAEGTIHGVEFIFPSGTTYRGGSFVSRRWLRAKAILKAPGIMRSFKGKERDVHCIAYVSAPWMLLYWYLVTRMLGILLLQDKSEYPFVLRRTSVPGKIYARLYTGWMFKVFDALIVMTRPLRDYFEPRVRKGAPIFHLPMTVEVERFAPRDAESQVDPSPYVAYCGFLGDNKDGVQILLKAFGQMAVSHAEVKLYIIGDAPGRDDLRKLRDLSTELGLDGRVVFTGRISRDEMPKYLRQAAVLALARPTSLQSQGGFPTKLGEYLSTGKPVVVTTVGEIPSYLEDNVSAFMAAPDSPEAFARRLEAALDNPEQAKRVGARGREVALEHFSHIVQGKRLAQFLKSLRSEN